MTGFDIIGDIHGCADKLTGLLTQLGFRQSGGVFRHPERQALFVGDLIDRGPQQIESLEIVRSMVDGGAARVTMGNHEFNAIAYATPDPRTHGEFLRPRSGPRGEEPGTARSVSGQRSVRIPSSTGSMSTGSRRCSCGSSSTSCG